MAASKLTALEKRLREAALGYPEATEEFPWGERTFKVRGKIFFFLNRVDGALKITAKLPQSGEMALVLPFCKPTGYGLGKAGWVSASFARDADVPEPMVREWLDESYRAVAPKRLVKALPG
jgi:predicted DNA-binding protein (MmcQ/YjbR family)